MLTHTYVDQTCTDNFTVVDPDTAALVGGLSQGDFTVTIYDPTGAERSSGGGAIPWSIEEKYADSGYYSIEFTPDVQGNWVIGIIHPIYFPWGKSGSFEAIGALYYSEGGGGIPAVEDMSNEELLAIILSQ